MSPGIRSGALPSAGRVRVGASIAGRGFRVRRVDYLPGYRREPHSHDNSSLTLVLHGDLRETACGRDEDAGALSVVVKPAGTVHSDEVGRQGARTVTVEIADDSLLGCDDRPAALGRWRWLHVGAGVRPLLALTRSLADGGEAADARELVLELLAEVVGEPGPPPHRIPSWIRRVRESIDDLAPAGVRVDVLADLAGVHPVSLTRAFRRAYGVPVTTYRNRRRLRHAVAEVVGSRRTLVSIAHAAGYADQAHFCRDVRRTTGLNPSSLRDLTRR